MINDSFLINGSFLNYLRSKGLIGRLNPIISEVSVISYETMGKIERKHEDHVIERKQHEDYERECLEWERKLHEDYVRSEESWRNEWKLEEKIRAAEREDNQYEDLDIKEEIRQEEMGWVSWANGMILQDEGGRGSGSGSEYDPLDFNY